MILELYKATLRSGVREVFGGLSFLAKPGERVAVTGGMPGDGSAVLQTFLGLRRLESGWACFDGEPVLPEIAACFRKSVAYLSRDFNFGSMTVESVAQTLFGERINRSVAYSSDRLSESLEQLGVASSCLAEPFGSLDAATSQRALMAITFMPRRQVALMDSPTLWQDERGRQFVAEYIASPRFDDVSVVVATDDRAILDVCSKVVSIDMETSTKETEI